MSEFDNSGTPRGDEARDEDWNDELRGLLASARGVSAPEDAKARVRMRISAALPPDPEGGGPAPSSKPLSSKPMLPRVPAWTLAATLAIGGVLGYRLGTSQPAQVQTVYIDRPVAVSPAPAPGTGAVAIRPEDLPKATSAPPSASYPIAQDLGKEREILDIAKVALGRGEATSALQRIEEHARSFPRGALAEEREALAIQALVTLGRSADAKARAARFTRYYPKSVLLPAVRASVGENAQ